MNALSFLITTLHLFFVDKTPENNSNSTAALWHTCVDCFEGFCFFRTLTFYKPNSWLYGIKFYLVRLFSLLRIKPGRRHFNNNLINFKPSQSNFTKCVIALRLSWPHVIGIDWPVFQSHMYVDHLLWPKAFSPFGYDYDKPEVKGNVFHCLWWQETKLFAQMSLSNVGMALVPPSSYLGLFYWSWNPLLCPLCSPSQFPTLWFCGLDCENAGKD